MIKVHHLVDKSQTGKSMHRMVNRFSGDLDNFAINNIRMSKMPLQDFYNFVKNMPYKMDSEGVEIITRPIHLLTSPFKGYDCKKKAVLVGSWLKQNNIPFQFIAVSSRDDGKVHHVLIRAKLNGHWVQIDPTYSKNKLFDNKSWTNAEILSGISSGTAPVLVELYGESDNVQTLATEFHEYRTLNDPSFLGAPLTAAGIVSIVVAALATATTVTVSIISAVQSRREDERKAESDDLQRDFSLESDLLRAEAAQKLIDAQEAAEAAKFKKYGLIAGGILAAVFFLR